MKNEMAIAKKFAKSNTTTKTEKTSRNIPVKLVILLFGGFSGFDKDSLITTGGVELVPLLPGILNSYIPWLTDQRSVLNVAGLDGESVSKPELNQYEKAEAEPLNRLERTVVFIPALAASKAEIMKIIPIAARTSPGVRLFTAKKIAESPAKLTPM